MDRLGVIDTVRERSNLIIDLGCGTGFSSEIIVDNGHRVIGIDILNDMLSKAKNKKDFLKEEKELELILADINFLPIRQASIDHIISVSAYNFILHGKNYINDISKTMNNTARYLKEILKLNGRIVIEFYPKDDEELEIFQSSFKKNGFDGFMIKRDPNQKSGQTFLLLKKR